MPDTINKNVRLAELERCTSETPGVQNWRYDTNHGAMQFFWGECNSKTSLPVWLLL